MSKETVTDKDITKAYQIHYEILKEKCIKQEQLLELYRLYFKLRDKIYTISPHREDGDHYNYLLEKLSDVERQIKVLENESK